MSEYMKYAAARERSVWKTLVTAACGHIVYVAGCDERDAANFFDACVDALRRSGIEDSVWSAHKANGGQRILFENGGEVRFMPYRSPRMRGTRAETVVMDT